MIASYDKFMADLTYGEVGERKAWEMLWNCDITQAVYDVRKDERYQAYDIDFVVQRKDGYYIYIEVKSDRLAHITGNFVYETKSNSNEGCLARSRANYVFYYLSETDKVYMVDLALLREHIKESNYREVAMGDNARGYLIPFYVMIQKRIAILIQ